jgi:hypothetical protein
MGAAGGSWRRHVFNYELGNVIVESLGLVGPWAVGFVAVGLGCVPSGGLSGLGPLARCFPFFFVDYVTAWCG